MKKLHRVVVALVAAALCTGLGAGQCLSADTEQTLHRDGSAFVRESRVTQADRQAAAKRAKAKGFKAQKVGASMKSDKATQTDKGAKK